MASSSTAHKRAVLKGAGAVLAMELKIGPRLKVREYS
jgi:hypothetical protein